MDPRSRPGVTYFIRTVSQKSRDERFRTTNGDDYVEILTNKGRKTIISLKDLIKNKEKYRKFISVETFEADPLKSPNFKIIEYYISKVLRYIGPPERKSVRNQKRSSNSSLTEHYAAKRPSVNRRGDGPTARAATTADTTASEDDPAVAAVPVVSYGSDGPTARAATTADTTASEDDSAAAGSYGGDPKSTVTYIIQLIDGTTHETNNKNKQVLIVKRYEQKFISIKDLIDQFEQDPFLFPDVFIVKKPHDLDEAGDQIIIKGAISYDDPSRRSIVSQYNPTLTVRYKIYLPDTDGPGEDTVVETYNVNDRVTVSLKGMAATRTMTIKDLLMLPKKRIPESDGPVFEVKGYSDVDLMLNDDVAVEFEKEDYAALDTSKQLPADREIDIYGVQKYEPSLVYKFSREAAEAFDGHGDDHKKSQFAQQFRIRLTLR